MIVGLRLEVNIIAACILLILLQSKRDAAHNMLDEQLYRLLLWVSLAYAAADSVAWLLDGNPLPALRGALMASNLLCYLFCVMIPYLWLLYAEMRLFEDEEHLWRMNRRFAVPLLVYSLLVLATPATGWMFSFNEQQEYCRGPLFWLQVVLTLCYMVLPTLRAFQRIKTTDVAAERQECYTIGAFLLFPLIGLAVQVLVYGLPAAIIATVLGELMIFINIQNKQISLDALTGLNNRGQLNRYLSIQTKKQHRNGNLYMMLLDLDRFKDINDTYGHKMGDAALVDTARALQRAGSRHGGFLARYGGDEFAVLMEKSSDEGPREFAARVQAELDCLNESGKRPYTLHISAGYAQFGLPGVQTVDELIEAADNRMYEIKQKRHAQQETPGRV